MLALHNSETVEATPQVSASCPQCGGKVISKCGQIKIWHWAHEAADCDPWSEPETVWHRDWKANFPRECREVTIGKHRADAKYGDWVFEFQYSSISATEIQEREEFYGRMCWVVDGTPFRDNLWLRDKGGFCTFRWLWPRKCWFNSRKPLFIDLGADAGDVLLRIRKVHSSFYGWGTLVHKWEFLKWASKQENYEFQLEHWTRPHDAAAIHLRNSLYGERRFSLWAEGRFAHERIFYDGQQPSIYSRASTGM